MSQGKSFDPKNTAHKAIAKKIEEKRDSLSDADKKKLAAELNGGQSLGVIKRILGMR